MPPPTFMIRKSKNQYIRNPAPLDPSDSPKEPFSAGLLISLPTQSSAQVPESDYAVSPLQPSTAMNISSGDNLQLIISSLVNSDSAKDEEKAERDEENADTTNEACIVCFEARPDAVLIECGHGGLCIACASRIWQHQPERRSCPLCRGHFAGVMRIVAQEGDKVPARSATPFSLPIIRHTSASTRLHPVPVYINSRFIHRDGLYYDTDNARHSMLGLCMLHTRYPRFIWPVRRLPVRDA
jgi:hypothetical protein